MANGSESMIQRISELFIEGNSEGDFSVKDPEFVARILYSLWLGYALMVAIKQRYNLSSRILLTIQIIPIGINS